VLLLEAGGSDDVPSVIEAGQWPLNIGSERDWGFKDHPNPHLNGRSILLSMGKVLGGGIQHKRDGLGAWSQERLDFFGRRRTTRHGATSRC